MSPLPSPKMAGMTVRSVGKGARSHAPLGLVLLFAGLMLYAAFGKGFAYAGWPPVFIGEVLMALVIAGSLRPHAAIPYNAAAAVTAVLLGFGVVQLAVDRFDGAVPLLETLRGLAPLYYSVYGFGTYMLLRAYEQRIGRAAALAAVERAVIAAAPWVIGVVTVLTALLLVEPTGLPTWPISGVPLLLSKPWDLAVTLVVFAPVVFMRLNRPAFGTHQLVLITMWCGSALVISFRSRGALLALVAGLIILRPHVARIIKGIVVVTTIVLLLYVTGVSVQVGYREMSYAALGDAVASVFGRGSDERVGGDYVATTEWRSEWWRAIWADVAEEQMLLHGHGWGDNLATRYGITSHGAADDPRALRVPHNIFLSLAGRAGLVVAVGLVVVVPVLTIGRTFRRQRDQPTPRTVEAARGGIVAALVASLTDVFLESPQGGIVTWSLLGFLWWSSAPAVEPGGNVGAGPLEGAQNGDPGH
jgi:hypothetical protein